MAELTATTADPCCAPEQHATCCGPSEKADCCGRGEGCGCGVSATATRAGDVREQVRERYAAAATQVTSTDPAPAAARRVRPLSDPLAVEGVVFPHNRCDEVRSSAV